ncbi:MAG: zf-HC2 domain-containing protein [Nitrospirota bacterium]|nr:zf-HC2 domain-containing protein [Nitrospirota bacterium]
MTCTNTHLREMLPSFLEGSLDAEGMALVRGHIARCSECSDELELLGMMSDEQVPDPGEAFWAALPDRVYRETQRTLAEKRTRSGWLREWWSGMPVRGAIAFAMIVLVSLVLLRPAHRIQPETTGRIGDTTLEDLYDGPAAVADLGPSDITLLNDWLEREITVLRQDLGRTAISANGFGRTLDEDLSTMDREELDDLVAELSRKQEV